MGNKTLVILALLGCAALGAPVRAIPDAQLARIQQETLWALGFQTAVAGAFVDFLEANFGPEKNLQALVFNAEAAVAPVFEKLDAETLVAAAARRAAELGPEILAGSYAGFLGPLETDLHHFVLTVLAADPFSDKACLHALLNQLLEKLLAVTEGLAAGSNRMPILHGVPEAEFATVRDRLVAQLRTHKVQLLLARALFVVQLSTDPLGGSDAARGAAFAAEWDATIAAGLAEEAVEMADEAVERLVLPVLVRMYGRKAHTDRPGAWDFVNDRLNGLAMAVLSPEQLRALLPRILGTSFATPGLTLETAEFANRFCEFVVSNWEAHGLPAVGGLDRALFRLDYLSCKPEAVATVSVTPATLDLAARFGGPANNFLFFLRYFRFYDMLAAPALAAPQAALFEALYGALLTQRRPSDNHRYLTREWLDFAVQGFGDTPLPQTVPTLVLLTDLAFGPRTGFDAALYPRLDPQLAYFRALCLNNRFVVEFGPLAGRDGYPEVRTPSLESLVLPRAGEVTEAEHAVLASPAALALIKDKVARGERVFKLTDLDPGFDAEEDVYVYLRETRDCACGDVAGQTQLFR